MRTTWTGHALLEMSDEEGIRRADVLRDTLRPLLAGEHPGVQGVALAALVAMHFAGYRSDIRDRHRDLWLKLVDHMVPELVDQVWRNGSPHDARDH